MASVVGEGVVTEVWVLSLKEQVSVPAELFSMPSHFCRQPLMLGGGQTPSVPHQQLTQCTKP